VIPQTLNWQVKESVFGNGSTVKTDYYRLLNRIKKSGYRGYLPVETLVVKGVPCEPFALVPEMLRELNRSMKDAN
jgi:hypothetical protein